MKRNISPFNGGTTPRMSSCSASVGTGRYQLSYRDVEEMMRERGLLVDHSTVFRWVQRYAPEINKRIRQHLKMRVVLQKFFKAKLLGRQRRLLLSM
jgi:hypothetical protein